MVVILHFLCGFIRFYFYLDVVLYVLFRWNSGFLWPDLGFGWRLFITSCKFQSAFFSSSFFASVMCFSLSIACWCSEVKRSAVKCRAKERKKETIERKDSRHAYRIF